MPVTVQTVATGVLLTAVTFAFAGCGAPEPMLSAAPAPRVAGAVSNPLQEVKGPLVVAVGNIACHPGNQVTITTCRDAATAKQTRDYNPKRVFLLGDIQYDSGTAAEFRDGFGKTWGDLKPISKPVPGNHEYRTSGARPYYDYFTNQQPGTPGYYAFNQGAWRIYALNSNCDKIDCAVEKTWLDNDMDANARKCSLIMMHHPLYSSGLEHGDSPMGRRFWEVALAHDADVALAGHDHNYERFRKMDADGNNTETGMVSFVAGAGGKSLYHSDGIRAGSQVYDAHRAGVLALKLGETRYAFQYQTIDGKTIDSGIGSCR